MDKLLNAAKIGSSVFALATGSAQANADLAPQYLCLVENGQCGYRALFDRAVYGQDPTASQGQLSKALQPRTLDSMKSLAQIGGEEVVEQVEQTEQEYRKAHHALSSNNHKNFICAIS